MSSLLRQPRHLRLEALLGELQIEVDQVSAAARGLRVRLLLFLLLGPLGLFFAIRVRLLFGLLLLDGGRRRRW